MKDKKQLVSFIRFQIDQLSTKNQHHQFEDLCRNYSRLRICNNILPATGPVSSGGDQGKDFETFKTYLSNTPEASIFAGAASTAFIAFSCSLDKRAEAKVKRDVNTIIGYKPKPDIIYAFSGQDITVSKRHKLQEWASDNHDIKLEVIDAQALSDHLSDPDLFWIAETYLEIPGEYYPEITHESDDEYNKILNKWHGQRSSECLNEADFVEIKRALRHSSEYYQQHLTGWFKILEAIYVDGFNESIKHKAAYEIIIISIKNKVSLAGIETKIVEYMDSTVENHDIVIAEDASVVLNCCVASILTQSINISSEQVIEWRSNLIKLAEEKLIDARSSKSAKARWLFHRGYLSVSIDLSENPPKNDINDAISWWTEMCEVVPEAPLFPLENSVDTLNKFAEYFSEQTGYLDLLHKLDALLEKRFGAFVVAEKSRDRAMLLYEKGKILGAVREIHRAKVNWFAEETIEGSYLSMLVLCQWYRALKLNYSAKYYALAAVYISCHSEDPEVRQRLPEALIEVALCDYQNGNWLGFVTWGGVAINAYRYIKGKDVELDEKSSFVQLLHAMALVMGLSSHLDASLFGVISKEAYHWDNGTMLEEMFAVASEELSKKSELQINRMVNKYDLPPFSEVGSEVLICWKALGIEWHFEWNNDYETSLAAEEIVSILQVTVSDLAGQDLLLLPSKVNGKVSIGDVDASEILCTMNPSNEERFWEIVVPAKSLDGGNDTELFHKQLISILLTMLLDLSLMPRGELTDKFERLISDGYFHKIFVAQRYQYIYEQFVDKERFDGFKRNTYHSPLGLDVNNINQHQELAWVSDRLPQCDQESIGESIKNRYDRVIELVPLTLDALKRSDEFLATAKNLRSEGWKDWHILLGVLNLTLSYHINRNASEFNSDAEAREFTNRFQEQGETDGMVKVPIEEFKEEKMKVALQTSMLSTLNGMGLTIHQQTPDFKAISIFLGERAGYWSSDIDHEPIFVK